MQGPALYNIVLYIIIYSKAHASYTHSHPGRLGRVWGTLYMYTYIIYNVFDSTYIYIIYTYIFVIVYYGGGLVPRCRVTKLYIFVVERHSNIFFSCVIATLPSLAASLLPVSFQQLFNICRTIYENRPILYPRYEVTNFAGIL